ncbi:DUF427 domain-containing protein [Arthrobacter agilis]|jgi:uncharacterized protein (DUF427 family)|uniref:DUF427 domain-containing protein n=1 Tax=Arthrobacter agilis TaxID=37921 RepID=UPI002780E2DE|nr:DUF427 domain-containing protein [Arthrobacter agilis]MDQ0734503.1 uncharacterized protein (DUF427 family) [Arthrobacter agilis]
MPKAVWRNRVIAESADTVMVEGNHYFPPESIAQEYFVPSEQHTVCHWKGTADYFSLEVDGERNQDAAWTYPDPKEAAENIRGHYAFWKGVTISD